MKHIALLFAWSMVAAAIASAPETHLAIENAAVHQYEDGPTVPLDQPFTPADTVFLSFEVSGYQKKDKPNFEGAHLSLSWTVDAVDPAGTPIVPRVSGKENTDITSEDKHWTPKVRASFLIPQAAPTGTYHLKITLRDELANAEISSDIPFHVRGRDVAPSDTLAIRNLRFYAAEDDRKPLDTAAYRAGETVWVKFDITGYKFAPGNEFQVSYGIQAILPSGKVGLSQADAATLTDKTFYPERYAPGEFSLPLPTTVPTGQHTIVITAHDKIGDQTAEARARFSVE